MEKSDGMRFSYLNNNAGFTLVEVVVALVLIGLIAGAFVPMISISFRNIRMVGERSKQLAEERAIMEKRLALAYRIRESESQDYEENWFEDEENWFEENIIKIKIGETEASIPGVIVETENFTTFIAK